MSPVPVCQSKDDVVRPGQGGCHGPWIILELPINDLLTHLRLKRGSGRLTNDVCLNVTHDSPGDRRSSGFSKLDQSDFSFLLDYKKGLKEECCSTFVV